MYDFPVVLVFINKFLVNFLCAEYMLYHAFCDDFGTDYIPSFSKKSCIFFRKLEGRVAPSS